MGTIEQQLEILNERVANAVKSKSRNSDVRLESNSPGKLTNPSGVGLGVSPSALGPWLKELMAVLQRMGDQAPNIGLSATTEIATNLAAGAQADFTVPVPCSFFFTQAIRIAVPSRITSFSVALYATEAQRDANAGAPDADDAGLVFADFNITDADDPAGGTYAADVLGMMYSGSEEQANGQFLLYGRIWNEDGLGAAGTFIYGMEAYYMPGTKAF